MSKAIQEQRDELNQQLYSVLIQFYDAQRQVERLESDITSLRGALAGIEMSQQEKKDK